MTTELKRCPICSAAAIFKHGGEISNGMRLVKVACSIGCVEQGIYHMTEEQATMLWNARIAQTSQPKSFQEENASLRQALRNMIDMVEGRFASDHPYTLINAEKAVK